MEKCLTICEICKKERWVVFQQSKSPRQRCGSCAAKMRASAPTTSPKFGKQNPKWKGGKHKTADGYIFMYLYPDDFFYSMTGTKNNYVLEHRLVMAKHLNRCLLPWEVVHHRNGIKDDNRLENLELFSGQKYHLPSMRWRAELKRRDKRIEQLEARVVLLEAENILSQSNKATSAEWYVEWDKTRP